MDESLHYTSVNHADSLIGAINKLRCNRQLCDVIIIVKNYRIPVHRLVLSACSPYFQNILETNWDFGVKELTLRNVNGEAVQMIIDFCYTSAISVNEDNVWTILPVAFTFQLEELVNLCCDYITSLIRNETCFQTHAVAVQCHCSDLKQLSANYIQDNFESLIEDSYFYEMTASSVLRNLKLLQQEVLTDDQVIVGLQAWVQHSYDDRKYHTAKIIHQFPELKEKLLEFLPKELVEAPFNGDDLKFISPFPSFSPSDLSESSYSETIMENKDSPLSKFKPILNEALRQYSSSPFSNSTNEKSSLSDTVVESLTEVIICTICGELFENQEELKTHHDECDDPELQQKLITMIKEGRDCELYPESNDTNSDASKPFLCPICGKSFGDKKNLGKHVKIHSREGHPCTSCTRKYSTRSNLQGHMRVHSSEKPYTCDYCGKAFDSYCILKVHIRTHSGERPFSCPTCGVSFAKNIHLRRHMQIHTGVKPHVCDICQKHFSRSDHLKRHKQSIHATEQKPHECNICKKQFVRKYELNRHLRQHVTNGEYMDINIPAIFDGNSATNSLDRISPMDEDSKPDPEILAALYKDQKFD